MVRKREKAGRYLRRFTLQQALSFPYKVSNTAYVYLLCLKGNEASLHDSILLISKYILLI